MEGTGLENSVTSVDQMLRIYPAILFGTPLGIIGLCVSAVMMVLTLVGERMLWIWIALAIYFASLGVPTTHDADGNIVALNRLLPPFEQLRGLNRPVVIFLLFMLAVRACFSPSAGRSMSVGGAMRAYFVFEIFTCLVMFTGADWSRGTFGSIVFCLILGSFGIGLGRWLVGPERAYSALRAILSASLLLIFGIAIHLLIKPSSIYMAGRLVGTTGNPQFLGAFLAYSLPTCYGLLLKRDETKTWRVAAACCMGLSIGFIFMSGSRAAVIVGVVGVLVFFRRRLGQFLLTSLVAIIVLFAAMQLFGDTGSAHLFSTGNSRAGVWAQLLEEFLAHPLFGSSTAVIGESSYLSVMAVYGLAGSIPFAIAVWLILRDSYRIVLDRRYFGKHAVLADIAVATVAEILVSGAFDGHLVGTLTPAVFIIYAFLAIYALLLDPAVFTKAPDGYGPGMQFDADLFSYVVDGPEFNPVPHAGGFGDSVHHSARL